MWCCFHCWVIFVLTAWWIVSWMDEIWLNSKEKKQGRKMSANWDEGKGSKVHCGWSYFLLVKNERTLDTCWQHPQAVRAAHPCHKAQTPSPQQHQQQDSKQHLCHTCILVAGASQLANKRWKVHKSMAIVWYLTKWEIVGCAVGITQGWHWKSTQHSPHLLLLLCTPRWRYCVIIYVVCQQLS